MKILTISLMLLAAPAFAECPPAPDHTARQDELIALLQNAPDEQSARPFNNALWELWIDAPDARAQEMLDDGMRRIRSYDLEGAVEVLDDLVDYCPDYAEGYNQRAFARFLMQDFDPALRDLDRALEMSPDHIGARAGRALTLMGLGRMRLAQTELRKALELNPWLPERSMLYEPEGTDL